MLQRSFVFRNLNRGDEYVKKVFDTVAHQYDMMNDVLSLGVHRLWKTHYVSNVVQPRPGMKFLDVAGGTGDIALRIYDILKEKSNVAFNSGSGAIGRSEIIVLDINQKMLDEGQSRAIRTGYRSPDLKWVCASGENIPFPDSYFDSLTIAFGIRNFTNRPKGLCEAHRVLKVGGAINILEFSSVQCNALKVPYHLWSDMVMPAAGRALSDEESYQYLVDSIKAFPPQEVFADMIREAGFGYVRYENLTGGIACIHTGVKTDTVGSQPMMSSLHADVEKSPEMQPEEESQPKQ